MTRRTVSTSWAMRATSGESPRRANRGASGMRRRSSDAALSTSRAVTSRRRVVSPRCTASGVVPHTLMPSEVISMRWRSRIVVPDRFN